MEGVVILNTFEEVVYTWGWTRWCTVFAILAAITLCGLAINRGHKSYEEYRGHTRTKKKVSWFNILCFTLCVFCCAATLCCARYGTSKTVPTYQVLLEDGVKISEFREQYTIIEEQGITYIVQDR